MSEQSNAPVASPKGMTMLGEILADKLQHSWIPYYVKNDPEGLASMADRAKHMPVEQMRWENLTEIATNNSDDGVEAWHRVLQYAQDELETGCRAAAVIEHGYSVPIDRARFLVLRRSLAKEWRPRGAVEWSLIDNLTQAMTMRERYLRELMEREHSGCMEDGREYEAEWDKNKDKYLQHYGCWIRPRVSYEEAMAITKADIERWDRMIVRTLRTLQNLRRYSVVINNPAQVNVGQQQVNVADVSH